MSTQSATAILVLACLPCCNTHVKKQGWNIFLYSSYFSSSSPHENGLIHPVGTSTIKISSACFKISALKVTPASCFSENHQNKIIIVRYHTTKSHTKTRQQLLATTRIKHGKLISNSQVLQILVVSTSNWNILEIHNFIYPWTKKWPSPRSWHPAWQQNFYFPRWWRSTQLWNKIFH